MILENDVAEAVLASLIETKSWKGHEGTGGLCREPLEQFTYRKITSNDSTIPGMQFPLFLSLFEDALNTLRSIHFIYSGRRCHATAYFVSKDGRSYHRTKKLPA